MIWITLWLKKKTISSFSKIEKKSSSEMILLDITKKNTLKA